MKVTLQYLSMVPSMLKLLSSGYSYSKLLYLVHCWHSLFNGKKQNIFLSDFPLSPSFSFCPYHHQVTSTPHQYTLLYVLRTPAQQNWGFQNLSIFPLKIIREAVFSLLNFKFCPSPFTSSSKTSDIDYQCQSLSLYLSLSLFVYV